jgi:4-alpha-glucanotransferase
VRDALIGALFSAGSELLLMPIQDVFGWNERINEPATVTDRNWTTKLPWPIDRFDEVPEACERRDRLRAWAAESHRI